MSGNCDVIVIFPIYGQFGAIWRPDSGPIVCKTYIFMNSGLISYKNSKNPLKTLYHSFHTIALSNGIVLAKKRWFFLQKYANISKIKMALVPKGIFSKTNLVYVLESRISSF